MQVVERVLVNLGSYEDAAIAAGIHPRTFERWRERGERDALAGKSNDYTDFYHRVADANRKIKAVLTGRVLLASSRDPKFALKILERRYADWAVRQAIEVKDVTPEPKASPRDRLIDRMRQIEERQTAADSTLGIDREGPDASSISDVAEPA
jgi:hypothetical protein